MRATFVCGAVTKFCGKKRIQHTPGETHCMHAHAQKHMTNTIRDLEREPSMKERPRGKPPVLNSRRRNSREFSDASMADFSNPSWESCPHHPTPQIRSGSQRAKVKGRFPFDPFRK